jgi:hypothetical protein
MSNFYFKNAGQDAELLVNITNTSELWGYCYNLFLDGELSSSNVVDIDSSYFQDIDNDKLEGLKPVEDWYYGHGLYDTSFNPPDLVMLKGGDKAAYDNWTIYKD